MGWVIVLYACSALSVGCVPTSGVLKRYDAAPFPSRAQCEVDRRLNDASVLRSLDRLDPKGRGVGLPFVSRCERAEVQS